MSLVIDQIPCLTDNYVYLLHDEATGSNAVVDPPEAETVFAWLKAKNRQLDFIFNTHHHGDHTGGNLALKRASDAKIIGPRADSDRIPGIDILVGDGEWVDFGAYRAQVFDVPGHTRGHIAYWFAEAAALFCGDTLFSLGCGRLFEGSPAQMWHSLSKLLKLPDETRIFCAHEYTAQNAKFALTLEPGNEALQARAATVSALRAKQAPTVPSNLGEERRTNPFLRPDSPELQQKLDMIGADPVSVFAEVRRRKDHF